MFRHLVFAVCATVFSSSAFAVSMDFSQAALAGKDSSAIWLDNVYLSNLTNPVQASFVWDGNVLKLDTINGMPVAREFPTGNWTLHYIWGCSGSGNSTRFVINDNGTFVTPDEYGYTGKWSFNAATDTYEHVYDTNGTTYTGKYDRKSQVSGTMAMRNGGSTGCFTMDYGNNMTVPNFVFNALDASGKLVGAVR